MQELDNYIDFLYTLNVNTKGIEKVKLNKTINRILARDIICKYDIPRFDNSAMDGFAIKLGYDSYVIGEKLFAGMNKKIIIKDNDAISITTGAKIPNGAQAVVQKELTKIIDNKLIINSIPINAQNIKFKGEDFKKGDILIRKGTKITPQIVAILASQGEYEVEVIKKVKIIVFSSGNEIASLDSKLKESQIYDINSYFIEALLKGLNCKVKYGGILNDNKDKISNLLKKATKKYDIVITSGGASVGDADYMHRVLENIDAKILQDSLNIKPGKPVILSKLDDTFILSLPGNPIGAFINFMFCAPILIQKISQAKDSYFESFEAINGSEFKLNPKTSNIILGNFKDGIFHAFKDAKYQGAQVSPLMLSNSFAIFKNKSLIKKDSVIKILLYKPKFLDKINNIFN